MSISGIIRQRLKRLSPKHLDYLHGFGLAFGILPQRHTPAFETDDAKAFQSDWAAVGNDMRRAISKVRRERSRP